MPGAGMASPTPWSQVVKPEAPHKRASEVEAEGVRAYAKGVLKNPYHRTNDSVNHTLW